MIERNVYNGWAFTENEREKGKINREIYEELKNKLVTSVCTKEQFEQISYKLGE